MPSLLSVTKLFVLQLLAQRAVSVSVCYNANGVSQADNVQCVGSSACCGSIEECLSNRLCQITPNGTAPYLLRGSCTYANWNDPGSNCPEVCRYEEQSKVWGIGIQQCADGSFCCDFGNTTCCSKNQGTFLDSNGNVILKSSTTSGTASATTFTTATTSSSATTTTPASSAITTPASISNGLSSGAKIGIGVGIPLGVILFCGLGYVIYLQRKRIEALKSSNSLGGASGEELKYHGMEMQQGGYYTTETPLSELPYPPQELDSRPNPNIPVAFR